MNLLDLIYIPVALVTAPRWAGKRREGWGERFGRVEALPEKPARGAGGLGARDRGTGASESLAGASGSLEARTLDGASGSFTREDKSSGAHAGKRVLLHAVSVGEVSALRAMVPLLLSRGVEVVVSATTDTGLKRAKELFGASCAVRRYPLDLSWAVARFLDAVRPDAVGLVELEVWPNFVGECARRGIPVGVVNGRLSERSFRGYRKIRGLLMRTFGRLAFAAVQEEAYRERFVALGVAAEKCVVAGSVKWDNATLQKDVPGAEALARELGIDRSRPLIVAGSTGPTREGGEEKLLHEACPEGVQLLCAPRKTERFDEAAAAMPGCVRRSETKSRLRKEGVAEVEAGGPPVSREGDGQPVGRSTGADRFLLDTIGELRLAYSLADVVVVGRSFGDLYGSDPLEPVGLGKATVIGPAVSDFATVVRTLELEGGLRRATAGNLREILTELIGNNEVAREVAERGRRSVERHRGASAVQVERLLGLLSGK